VFQNIEEGNMKQDEIRILFVEDDDMIRDLYCDILQSRNWSCKAAKNGNEALKIIPSFQPHIMITDLLMPEKNGFDLIDEV
jgi:DNA-binding response OmpR family regulator